MTALYSRRSRREQRKSPPLDVADDRADKTLSATQIRKLVKHKR